MKKFLALLLVFVAIARGALAQRPNLEELNRLKQLPRVLIHGKVISAKDGNFIIHCDNSKWSHPSTYMPVAPSQDRFVRVGLGKASLRKLVSLMENPVQQKRIPILQEIARLGLHSVPELEQLLDIPSTLFLSWKNDQEVSVFGREDGTYTYTTVLGAESTVTNINFVEELPAYSVVVPFDLKSTATKVAERGTTQTP